MNETLPIRLDLHGHQFTFQLHQLEVELGPVIFDQFWLDRRQLYGQRRRSTQILNTVLGYYWLGCLRAGALKDTDTPQTYLLGHLLPNTRTIGAQRVFADASVSPALLAGSRQDRRLAEQLQQQLSEVSLERLSEKEFHDQSRSVLAPTEYSDTDRSMYLSIQSELFGDSIARLVDEHDAAVAEVRANWARLIRQFGRPRGHAAKKQVLDVFSYEARAAFHRCYSQVWLALIPALITTQQISRESALFHRLWHLETAEQTGAQLFRLFHGHVLALHPAAALLIQTSTGRSVIGLSLVDPSNTERFEEFLYALLVAIHTYAGARDEFNAQRRGRGR